mmetsp:Transcript_4324/g.10980  ORF Transcript_4324/g.10980 Transcript_4324/m.10980 type:complete len:256 (+) Transcript_4324:106-873(+)
MDQDSSNKADIDAWRRVHRQLTLALMQSRDNIAAELTKRRYLLEEMKMQNTQKSAPGNSGNSSKAKKKVAPKKIVPKKASADLGKVKKVVLPGPEVVINSPPKAKLSSAKIQHRKTDETINGAKIQPQKTDGIVHVEKMQPQKIDQIVHERLVASVTAPHNASGLGCNKGSNCEQSKKGDDEGEVLNPNPQFSEIAHQQMSQMYYAQPYGVYGNLGMGVATPQQMSLAVQMMQQMNQNFGMTEDEDSEEEGTTIL